MTFYGKLSGTGPCGDVLIGRAPVVSGLGLDIESIEMEEVGEGPIDHMLQLEYVQALKQKTKSLKTKTDANRLIEGEHSMSWGRTKT